MSEETDNKAVAQPASEKAAKTTPVEAPVNETVGEEVQPKKSRRGIASARGTQRLKFTHQLANNVNGLFLAHLESVGVSMITIGEASTGMPSFNGLEIPKLTLTFASNEEDANKRHYAPLSFTAVESNVKTIPGGSEEWKVNAIFDWFKHLMNVFVLKGAPMTAAQEDALTLAFEDFDEQGEYVPLDSEVVIEGYKLLFENLAAMLNGSNEGKPTYTTKDGKMLPLWIKLLRHQKTKKGWTNVNNGDLAFPTFVGEGCIERFVQNAPTSIRVDGVKEAIHPMVIEKAKAPNMGNGMPAMGGGGPIAGVGFGAPASGFSDIAGAAGDDDVPF